MATTLLMSSSAPILQPQHKMVTRSRKRRPVSSPERENDENSNAAANSIKLKFNSKLKAKKGFERKRSRVLDEEDTTTTLCVSKSVDELATPISAKAIAKVNQPPAKAAVVKVQIEELPEGAWRPEGEEELLKVHEETVVMETEELQEMGAFEDADKVAAECVAAITSYVFTAAQEQWSTLYSAITNLRRLAICHPSVVAPVVGSIIAQLCTASQNLRSSIIRNALFCLKELFEFVGGAMSPHVESIIYNLITLVVLSDKKFIKTLAFNTAKSAIAAVPAELMLNALLPCALGTLATFTASHVPMPDASSQASVLLEMTLASMQVGSKPDTGFDLSLYASGVGPVVVAVSRFLGSKTVEGKDAARKSCRRLRRALGKAQFETSLTAALGIDEKATWYAQQVIKAAEPKMKKKAPALSLKQRMALSQKYEGA